MRRVWRLIPVLVIGGAGCTGGNPAGAVGDSTYVRTMADLRRLEDTSKQDSAARAAARRAILAKHGVTVQALDATARELASEPDRAVAVWKAVDQRLQPPPAAPAPGPPKP